MEKDKRRKKVDDTKPDAEDVIDELLEGVDLKQGAPEEADSKYLSYARHYNPRFVGQKRFLRSFFRKILNVRLVFKSGF